MIELQGKNILITGAAGSGVGFGIANVVYQAGAHVIIHDINEGMFTDKLKAKYPQAEFVAGDLRDKEFVKDLFSGFEARGILLHGLVNNAGIGLSKPTHEVEETEFTNLFDVDVKAVWRLSKYFICQCLNHGIQGSIVNISSVHAHSTIPRYAIYASAKGGVEALTRGMSIDYGSQDIRVNAIAPGYVHSDQNYELIATWSDDPVEWVKRHSRNQQCIEREVTPQECGYLAAFLMSDLAQTITGQVIRIDGGSTALLYNKDFL
ncbi:SDR family oxidoreductase [Vibrio vulnificus]|nr:SDR family oxidoreductase [Vibrio vulnificus]